MSKPKIVLIDDNLRYVFSLQAKLGETYLNDIDLEVITERAYYHEYFLEPKSIDLLIIDEKFYESSINKHNIKKVILLTEDEDLITGNNGNVFHIYKYSNIRDIFNVINSRSVGLRSSNHVQNGTKVILVTSAVGGVGKTTIALGLSMALEKDYKKALYIDAESFQTFNYLIDHPSLLNGNDLVEMTDSESLCDYMRSHIVDDRLCYLPAFNMPIVSFGLSFDLYKVFIGAIKKTEDYDYIIVDSDSTFNEDKVELMGCADKVIFVTNQTRKGCYATNQIIKHISEINDGKYLFVCNRFNKKTEIAPIREELDINYPISEYVENYSEEEIELHVLPQLNGIKRISILLQ